MFDERPRWNLAEQSGFGWPGAFVQMMSLPFQLFSYGLDVLGQTLRTLQETAALAPDPGRVPFQAPSPGLSFSAQDPLIHGSSRPTESTNSSFNPLGVPPAAAPDPSKENVMSCCDTNLSDDMLKLVQYSIVCIERDREEVLVCNACKLFADNMNDCDFDSWVIADYVQHHALTFDKKYLRVTFQVLGRWPQQDLRYEQKELRRLAGIEAAILSLREPKEEK